MRTTLCCYPTDLSPFISSNPSPEPQGRNEWFPGTYTSRFNRRHKLFGHLFSGRYKSLLIDASNRGHRRSNQRKWKRKSASPNRAGPASQLSVDVPGFQAKLSAAIMNTAVRAILCPALIVLFAPLVLAQPAYKSGYSSIMKLGRDLYSALSPEQQKFLSPQPISIETDPAPFIRLLYFPDDEPVRGVWISAGFIDFINQVAHAQAINKKRPGYLGRYIQLLSDEPSPTLPPLPDAQNPEFWTDAVLNEQLSNFNSIVGVIVGIKLAHHHLGHYEKYKRQLTDKSGKPVPINRLLTPSEWNQAFTVGVQNALRAGCLMEGAIPFFQAFGKINNQPAWLEYFLPPAANPDGMKKEMENLQRKFIAGED